MLRRLAAVVMLPFAAAGHAAEPAPAPRRVGLPGESVAGRVLRLSVPPRVAFGRPLVVTLTGNAPDVRVVWDGPYQTVRVELKTGRGEVVPVALDPQRDGPGGGYTYSVMRLVAAGPPARGGHLAPGRYWLRAAVDARRDPFDRLRYLGRLEALPVAFTVGPEPRLTAADTRALIAALAHPSPAVRRDAVRRVPPTADPALLTALVAVLADPHEESWPSFRLGATWRPIAHEAAHDALPGQGRAAVGPLLDFVAKPEHAEHRTVVAGLLGRLGYDDRSLAYLTELAGHVDDAERHAAVNALGRLGPAAAPRLVRIARDRGRDDITRRLAIEALACRGTPETVGEFFREALGYERDEHRWAAADGLAAVGSRVALAELRERAEDEREEQNVRARSLRAYVRLADPADAHAVLRRLKVDDPPGEPE